MKQLLSTFILVFIVSAFGQKKVLSKSYSEMKSAVDSVRQHCNPINSALEMDKKAPELFTRYLVDSIIPYWYGTKWDFNGHTNIPNQGEIACGYFVSTTLKHMGVNVNRYKMAQQGGLHEALTLASSDELIRITVGDKASDAFRIQKISNKLKNGLWFVGLDNHVGYVYKSDKGLEFVHSDYGDLYVRREKAIESFAFKNSDLYVFAPITHNEELMRKWYLGEIVEVKTP